MNRVLESKPARRVVGDPTSRGSERTWPAIYARWRASRLGAITDRIEHALIFDTAGRLAGKRVLDVGCGDGTLAVYAAEKGADVVGLDASAAMIEVARAKARQRGAEIGFVLGRAERLPFADGSFDLVFSITTLCFVADAPRALGEMARVLKPGGSLLIGELGGWSVWAASRRLRGWLGDSTWAAARFWNAARLRELVAGAGLAAGPVMGAVYYPPSAWLAGVMAPVDRAIGRVTAAGAAFLLVPARKPIGGQVAKATASPEP